MCDCYEQKCEACDEMILVHIADFCTPRENLQVFCQAHLPDNDCFIHTVIDPKEDRYDYKKGTKFGFRILDKTRFNYGDYEPYEGCDPELAKWLKEYHRQQRYMVWDWATPNIGQNTKLEVV